MKPVRTLSLRREALGELSPAELRDVAGGGHSLPDPQCLSWHPFCTTEPITGAPCR